MRRIVWLQVYLTIMLTAAALFVETGDTRLRLFAYRVPVTSYSATDHTDEVVFIGSSVVGSGVIPDAVSDGLRQRDIDQEVYNLFFHAGVAPTYRTALRDLVLTNGKPRLVVLCISPRDLNDNSLQLEPYVKSFASLSDALAIIRDDPCGKHHLLWPLLSRSSAGLVRMAQQWSIWAMRGGELDGTSDGRCGSIWDYQDGSSEATKRNVAVAGTLNEAVPYQDRLEITRASDLVNYATQGSQGLLDGTITMAKTANIEVALCLFDYSDEARAALAGGHIAETERILADLAQKQDVALWRTSVVWPPIRQKASHFDGVHHLEADAAMAMSRAFGEGPLADLLLDLQK